MNLTFATLAEKFMKDSAARKRKPLRPSSLRAYRSDLDADLLPFFGQKQVQSIDGEQVKSLVAQMADNGLSGASITRKISLFKKILRSLRDQNGNQVLTAAWSSEYLDIPESSTKVPTITQQGVQDAISKAIMAGKPIDAVLYVVLAATGLRISEALAVRLLAQDDGISTIWVPGKIIVRQQLTRQGYGPTKTQAGQREVDLSPELNRILEHFVVSQERKDVLFPCCEDSYRNRLEEHGILGGFHVFRRFRISVLRMLNVPDPLVKFWVGHAAANVTEHYTQVGGELQARKEWAEKAGLGFQTERIL